MKQRSVPALDTRVGAVGLGCMGMSWAYVAPDERDERAGIEVIRHALDRGVTFLDTSDVYGAGHNERLVGRALHGRRDEAVVATKVGLVAQQADGGTGMRRDGRPEHIRAAVDASLDRLGVDVIDLYYLHRVDPDVPLEDSWGALAEQVAAGKVRSLGLSEVGVEDAERAHAVHPVAAVQSEFSLWTRDPSGTGTTSDGAPTGDVIGWTAGHDAVFVPFSPLGRGFLTGTLDTGSLRRDDFRANLPRFSPEAAAANEAIVAAIRGRAAAHDVPPSAVALAWVLAQGEHIIPIPGTTKLHRLEENIAAIDVELTPDDLREIDDAQLTAEGARYGESTQRMVDR